MTDTWDEEIERGKRMLEVARNRRQRDHIDAIIGSTLRQLMTTIVETRCLTSYQERHDVLRLLQSAETTIRVAQGIVRRTTFPDVDD